MYDNNKPPNLYSIGYFLSFSINISTSCILLFSLFFRYNNTTSIAIDIKHIIALIPIICLIASIDLYALYIESPFCRTFGIHTYSSIL